jgi:hypothetical protein
MYTYSSKIFALLSIVAVLAGFAVISVVTFQAGPYNDVTYTGQQTSMVWGQNVANPSSPVRIRLGITSPPALGKTAELVVIVTSAMDASDVKVHIALPSGFVMTSGTPDWKGNIARDDKVELHYTIQSVQVGDWTIEGSVEWRFAGDSFYKDSDRICISVTADSASISTCGSAEAQLTEFPPANETQPPTLVSTTVTTLLPPQEIGELVIFVSPDLVSVGVETEVTILYATRSPGEPESPPTIVLGGPPSFEGPVIVTYGPVARQGMEWVAKIKPTSIGVIIVNGCDQSGQVCTYAEITVAETLPPPADQLPMPDVTKESDHGLEGRINGHHAFSEKEFRS